MEMKTFPLSTSFSRVGIFFKTDHLSIYALLENFHYTKVYFLDYSIKCPVDKSFHFLDLGSLFFLRKSQKSPRSGPK
jgi:hypothetical protein